MAQAARAAVGRHGPARIAVVGEFNSGKTALVNALVGAAVLPASPLHHTPCPVVIGYAKRPALTARHASGEQRPLARDEIERLRPADATRVDLRLPLPALEGLRVVDTPGFGLGALDEDVVIRHACRGADLTIWCTPAFQAWKHSERTAWLKLPERARRYGLLAVTFWDTIPDGADIVRLMARLQADAGPHFRHIVLADGQPAVAIR
jgi:GTPase Era involved in 16S rRNA processing